MSNGVEVIVKGNKTAYAGYEKGIHPFPATPHAITFPPYTVSRQFHLIDHPNKLHNPIDHLLHSIVRSVSPDLVTKTLLTTFTYFSTILDKQSSTVVSSREETISNVVTQKFRPTVEYTPRIQETPTILPQHFGGAAVNSYLTNTMTTTYVYYNTFTADSIPIVITRTELVSNVMTVPAYMISLTLRSPSPSTSSMSTTKLPALNTQEINIPPVAEGQEFVLPTYSRVFETETYFTTLLFSKTMFDNDDEDLPTSSKVLTTQEILTQVVVTEALVPVSVHLTATPQKEQFVEATPVLIVPSTSTIEKTFYTTFTHFSTFLNGTDSYVQSSTHLTSNVVTEQLLVEVEHTPTIVPYDAVVISPTPIASPLGVEYSATDAGSESLEYGSLNDLDPVTFLIQNNIIDSGNFDEFHLHPSVMESASELGLTGPSGPSQIYEPVMIYATKTYFTTYTYFTSILGEGPSATKIQSRTQIVSRVTTEALATELIAQHLNVLKMSYLSQHSTLLEVTSSVHAIIPTRTIEGSYVPDEPTSSILWPHWPKDEDEAIMDPFYPNAGAADMASITIEPILVHKDFEETMSSEIHHIVNVLTDTIGGSTNFSSHQVLISPTAASVVEEQYSSSRVFPTITHSQGQNQDTVYEEITLKSPQEIDHDDEYANEFTSPSSDTEVGVEIHNLNSATVTHSRTPPLSSAHTTVSSSPSAATSTSSTAPHLKTQSKSAPSTSSQSTTKPASSGAAEPAETKTTTEINEDNVFPDFVDDDLGIILDSAYNDMHYGDISSLVDLFVKSQQFSSIRTMSTSSTFELAYLSSGSSPVSPLATPYPFETPKPDLYDEFESPTPWPSLSSEFNQDSLMLLKKTGLSPVYDYSSYEWEPWSSTLIIKIVPSKVPTKIPHSPVFDLFSEITADDNSDEFGARPKHPDYYDEVKEDDVFKEAEHDDLDTTNVYNLNTRDTTLSSNSVLDDEIQINAAGATAAAPTRQTTLSTKNKNKNTEKNKDTDTNKKVSLGVGGSGWIIQRPFGELIDSFSSTSAANDRFYERTTTKPPKTTKAKPSSTLNRFQHKVTVQATTPMSAEGDAGVPSSNVHQIHSSVESSTSGELMTVIKFTSDGSPNTSVIKIPKNDTVATANGTSTKKPLFTFAKDKPAPTMPTLPPTKEIKLKPPIDYTDEDYLEDPEIESATQVYHLIIKDGNVADPNNSDVDVDVDEVEDDAENSSDGADAEGGDKKHKPFKGKKKNKTKKGNKKKNQGNKHDEGEHESEHHEDEQEHEHHEHNSQRRPPTMFSGPGITMVHDGPSTNSGGGGGGPVVTTGGTTINWKPLLNLGAIGLGGLGASTLTKLSPLLSSMAGYIKHGFAPVIARNDTQGQYSTMYKQDKPLFPSRYPPHTATHEGIGTIVPYQKEPNVIPVGQFHQQKRPSQLLRHPNDNIPRRPIMSHANQEQFQGAATSNTRPFFPQNSFQVPNERQPTSHAVKVVSGTPVLAGPVNRTPTFHHLFRNSGEKKRQPTFIRPPPRSQEPPHPKQRPSTVLVPVARPPPTPPRPYIQQQQQQQHRDEDEDVEEDKSIAYAHSHELGIHSHDDQIPPNLNLLRVPPPTEMEQINRPSTAIRPRPYLPDAHSSPIPEASNEVHSTLFPPRNRIPFEKAPSAQTQSGTSSEEFGLQLPHSFDVAQNHWPNLPSSTLNSVFHTGEKYHTGESENKFINSYEEPSSKGQNQGSDEHKHFDMPESNEIGVQVHGHLPNTFNVVMTEKIPVQGHHGHGGGGDSDEHEHQQQHSIIGPQLPMRPQIPMQAGQGTITRLQNRPFQGQGPILQPQGPIPVFGQHSVPQHQTTSSEEHQIRAEHEQFMRHHQQMRPTPEFNHVHIPEIPATNIDHQPFRPILENEPPTAQFRPPSHYNGAAHNVHMLQNHQQHQQQQEHPQPPPSPSLIPFDFVSTSRRPPPIVENGNGNIFRQHLSTGIVAPGHGQGQGHPVLLPGMQQIPPWPIETMHGNENTNSHPQFARPPPFMVHQQQQQSHEQQSHEGPLPPPLLPGFFAPTPHIAPHQVSPTTVFYVHETYDPPPAQEPSEEGTNEVENEVGGSSHIAGPGPHPVIPPFVASSHRPPPQQLIISEIPPQPTTPKSTRLHPTFIRSSSTTTERPVHQQHQNSNGNSESDEHGIGMGNEFMKSGGFIVSPTIQDMFDRKPFGSNSSGFNLDKFFLNPHSQSDEGSFDKMVGGSEDKVSIIDPHTNHVIKSPLPPHPSSTASPATVRHPNHNSQEHDHALDEDNIDENELLNAFTLPEGFFSSTIGDDFWAGAGTTFRPFANFGFRENFTGHGHGHGVSSTTPVNDHKDLVWHDIFPTQDAASSLSPNIVDQHQPTTFRNILQPTTFRPNLFRRPPNESPVRRPDGARRPGALLSSASNVHANTATANSFYDDEEGIENIKLKNVEIHKRPEFAKGPIRGQHNQHQHPVLAFIPGSYEEESSAGHGSTGNSQTGSDGSQVFKKPFYSLEDPGANEDDDDVSEIQNVSTGSDIVKTHEREQQQQRRPALAPAPSPTPRPQPMHSSTQTEEDTNETFELGPPGYPMTRLRPPPPQPQSHQVGPRPPPQPRPQGPGPQNAHGNVNAQNGRRPVLRPIMPPPHQPPHPGPGQGQGQQHQQPPRPSGPFDAITNLFRRPLRPRPDGPHPPPPPPHGESPPRRPPDGSGNGNVGHLNIVRKPQPTPEHGASNSNARPQPGLNPESTFNKIRPIPLNPAAENSNVNQNYQLRRPIIPPELVRRPQAENSEGQQQQRPFRRPLQPQQGSGEQNQNHPNIRRPINAQNVIRRPQRPQASLHNSHEQSLEGHESEEHGHGHPEENDLENEVLKQVEPLHDFHNQIKEEIENSIEAVRPRPVLHGSVESHEHGGSGSFEQGNVGGPRPPRPLGPGQRKRIRKPKPFPPQAGTLVVEANPNPPSSDSSTSVEIHEYKDHRHLQPETEMAPPPIDSLRHKPAVLELPTLPPPADRPRRPNPNNPNFNRVRQRLRPNLLRPDAELLKPTLARPTPTFHTIASVDDDNKIVATNVVPMIHNNQYHESSKAAAAAVAAGNIKPSQTLDSAENFISSTSTNVFSDEDDSPEQIAFELASSIVDSAEDGSNSRESSSAVVHYVGGRFQTGATAGLPRPTPIGATASPEEDEHEDVSTVVNTRTGVIQRTRVRVSTRVHSGESGEGSSAGASRPITPTTTAGGFTPINVSPTPTKTTPFPPFSSRRPFTRPRFTTAQTTRASPPSTTPESTLSTLAKRPVFSRRPFLPTRSPTAANALLPWNRRTTSSSTSRPEDEDEHSNEVDGEDERTSEELKVSTSTSSSVTSKTNSKDRVVIPFKYNRTRVNFFSTTPKVTTSTEFSVSTAEDKDAHSSQSQKSSEAFKPTTFRPAIRPNLLGSSKEHGTYAFNTKPVPNSTTTVTDAPSGLRTSTHVSISSTESSSSEETEQIIDAAGADAKETRTQVVTKNGTITVVTNGQAPEQKISPTRTITGIITSNRGASIITSIVSSGATVTLSPDDDENAITAQKMRTRYVTSSETETHVFTETETNVLSSAGFAPITQTIVITRTVPPQTLISTIIGSVTLVNSVEIKPTLVRSTMYSEATQAHYDTTGSPTEKVLHGQVGVIKTRPKATTVDPLSDSSSTHVSITSKESSSSFEIVPKRKIKPYLIEPGCQTHNCSMQGNQVCKAYAGGIKSKCVCAPGYARVKSNAPCRPTFTYEMNFAINHMDGVSFNYNDLKNDASEAYLNFITMTKDALDKIFLTTVITRDFQGTEVMKIDPRIVRNEETHMMEPKVDVDFLVQLRKNMTLDKIKGQLVRSLRNSNFTMGKAGLITSSSNMSDFSARDFNECAIPVFNDCDEHADCINVLGSYRCQCQAGFRDRGRRKKPGRDCIEMAGCAECSYRGNCYTNRIGQTACNCFRWYGGSQCHINLKILLMAIIGIVGVLFLFVLLCGFLLCRKKKRNPGRVLTGPGSGRFMRYRSPTSHATLDRAAIMHDSASSSDGTRTPPVRANLHSHHHQQQHSFTPDSLLIDSDDNKNTRGQRGGGADLMNFSLRNVVMDQQDRSLTVVIPRAKIRSSSRPSSRPNTSSAALGPDVNSDLAAAESKLMSFLDPAPGSKHIPPPPKMPGECLSRQSTSQRNKEAKARKLSLQERRISSGALVSSGTEVSARGGMRRRSTGLEPDLPIRPYEKTVSDVRSYDETTVRSHARPLFSSETSRASCYSCKPPSYCAYSEFPPFYKSATGHTMAEKDGASTVYTTQGKLFRLSNDTDSNLSSD